MVYSVIHPTKGALFTGSYDDCQQHMFHNQDIIGSLTVQRNVLYKA